MIHSLISYFTLKLADHGEYARMKIYRDYYGNYYLKTSRWSFFSTQVISEDVRKHLDDWYHL